MAKQIKSRERVTEHGEVFTAEREVNAMLDLVKSECIRPDSRFLEPACGDGNFLSAILERKLAELRRRYKSAHRSYEIHAVEAIGSLYGVDIMKDNVEACRQRLFNIWDREYTSLCKEDCSDETRDAVRFIIWKKRARGHARAFFPTVVTHKKFGIGQVTKIGRKAQYIFVAFNDGGEKKFLFPGAFAAGFLSL